MNKREGQCPFCGHQECRDTTISIVEDGEKEEIEVIRCENCGVTFIMDGEEFDKKGGVMKNIKEGDKVKFNWINGKYLIGVVEHIPQGSGDLWYVRNGNAIYAINPCCTNFEEIVKIETD